MLELLKVPSNNGYHKFTTEELTQVKMLDLRQIMKDKGVRLVWANGQYESQCPFHPPTKDFNAGIYGQKSGGKNDREGFGVGIYADNPRAPRLFLNQKEGVWRWQCAGGHHGGDTISFAMECHGTSFPRAVEYLRKMITRVPGLDAGGVSIKEILLPVVSGKSSVVSKDAEEKDAFLLEKAEDRATFKYGELIYTAKDLKTASRNSLRIILKLQYKDGSFTDKIDLHSARARRSFANQASERLNLQSAQIEEHLEAMMESLEKQFASCRLPVNRKTGEQENMSSEERNEALTLLKDPNLLERMSQDLDKLGYVGEAINKKILYLVGTSRLLDKPISAIVRSGSGAGKSALIEQVLSLMPQEDVLLFSRITPQSLFYMGREALDRKILAIDERSGSESADYSIRTLQSSGKLSFAAPQKDTRSGEWKTLTREFSARTPYIESSTKEKLNEENLNRCFELYLDESPEQTKRILEAQRKSAAGLDQISEEEKAHLKKLYQNAQKLLDAVEVKVPYELEVSIPHSPPHQSAVEPKGDNERPGSLTSSKFFGVGASWIRTRRDHERFLSLVKVIALVHQYQRKDNSPAPSLKERGEENGVMKRVTATKEDAELAQALLRPILGELSCDLSKPIQNFYELLKKKVNEEAEDISIEDFAFTRRQVRSWLGLPDHIVKRAMKALEDLEYIQTKGSIRGSRHFYWLVNNGLESGIAPRQSEKVGQNGD